VQGLAGRAPPPPVTAQPPIKRRCAGRLVDLAAARGRDAADNDDRDANRGHQTLNLAAMREHAAAPDEPAGARLTGVV